MEFSVSLLEDKTSGSQCRFILNEFDINPCQAVNELALLKSKLSEFTRARRAGLPEYLSINGLFDR